MPPLLSLCWVVAETVKQIVILPFILVGWLFSLGGIQPPRPPKPSVAGKEITRTVFEKANEPLFATTIRLEVLSARHTRTTQLAHRVLAAFAPYATSHQALRVRRYLPLRIAHQYRSLLFRYRIPSIMLGSEATFSVHELAQLYHVPHDLKHSSMQRTLIHELPMSPARRSQEEEVIFGTQTKDNEIASVGISHDERQRHVYIVGGTGSGKSTLLEYAIVQDMKAGRGVGVIDPHGDLATFLLGSVPPERIKDVIYFNPDDVDHPVRINLLEVSPKLKGTALLREKDLIAESIVSLFRKLFSDDEGGGHRIEYILRNTIHTALTIKDATLFTVYRLLNDATYRKSVVQLLKNKDLVLFWENEFGRAGSFQQVKMISGITAKIGRFLFSASARQLLEHPHSTIDFNEILNGKIFICNISKGRLGEDTSELFGIALLTKLQLAAYKRARVAPEKRHHFYLYVDEFQTFATPAFIRMLSEARKYGLCLTIAEQSSSQQSHDLMGTLLANVGTIICLRTANPEDERLLLPLFAPFLTTGELSNLPNHTFYMRAHALRPDEPCSAQTILTPRTGDTAFVRRVVTASRRRYAATERPGA